MVRLELRRSGGKLMRKELELKKKFHLKEEFRNMLFQKALQKEGSLRQLGRKMGYTGSAPNYYVNRMWRGEQAIRIDQLRILAKITGIPLSRILDFAES
ncbi:MAG: hypothetical protein QXF61_10485 [Nitrososphaeria archaeon]